MEKPHSGEEAVLNNDGDGIMMDGNENQEAINEGYILELPDGIIETAKADINNDVFGELEHHLKPHDLATLNGRPARWHSRTEFAKSQMQKEGLVESARQGMWRITDGGRKNIGEVL